MKIGKQKYFAIIAAVAIALFSIVTVHAFTDNDPPANSNTAGNGSSDQQSTDNNKSSNQSSKDENSSDSKSHNSTSTSVTINGQKVDVPQNGSYESTVDGVRVRGNNSQSSSSSGGSATNNSSTSVNIQSQ